MGTSGTDARDRTGLCFGGLDEIGWRGYFWASTAVIIICRGGELGVAYIARSFPVSVLSHNCILREMDTDFRGFCINSDEAARH